MNTKLAFACLFSSYCPASHHSLLYIPFCLVLLFLQISAPSVEWPSHSFTLLVISPSFISRSPPTRPFHPCCTGCICETSPLCFGRFEVSPQWTQAWPSLASPRHLAQLHLTLSSNSDFLYKNSFSAPFGVGLPSLPPSVILLHTLQLIFLLPILLLLCNVQSAGPVC